MSNKKKTDAEALSILATETVFVGKIICLDDIEYKITKINRVSYFRGRLLVLCDKEVINK